MSENKTIHDYLKAVSVTNNTLSTYRSALTKFNMYMMNNNIDEPTEQAVNQFRDYMLQRGYKKRFTERTIDVCNRYLKWYNNPEAEMKTKRHKLFCECGTEKVRTVRGGYVCPVCRKQEREKAYKESKTSRRTKADEPVQIKNVEHEQCRTCEYRTYGSTWDNGSYCNYSEITGRCKMSIAGCQSPPNCTVYKRINGRREGNERQQEYSTDTME